MIENPPHNIKLNSTSKFIISAILIAVLLTLFFNSLPYLVVLTVLIFLIYLFGRRGVLFLILTSYMTLVGEINVTLRLAVHIFGFGGLIYLFISEYGFNFSCYKKLPKIVINLIVLLFSAMLISSIFSNYLQAGLIKIIQMIYFFLIIYITYSLIKNDKDVKTILAAFIFSAVIMSSSFLLSLFKSPGSFIEIISTVDYRKGGLIGNINALAVFFAVGVPLVFTLLHYSTKTSLRFVLLLVLFLLSLGLLTTISRAAILSTLISLGIIIFFFHRKMFYKILTFFSILFFIILLIAPLRENLFLFFRLNEGLSQRDQLWQLAFNIIKDKPLTGIGPGAYSYVMFNYFPVLLDSIQGQIFIALSKNSFGFNDSHNFYLTLFSDLGIMGLFVSLFLPFAFIVIAKKAIYFSKLLKSEGYKLIIGLTAVGMGLFIRGFFEGISLITYGWITVDLPFWLVFTLLIHIYVKLKSTNITQLNLLDKKQIG